MKPVLFYRQAVISLLLIYLWCVYMFFNYYTEPAGMFRGFTLFFEFIYTCTIAAVLAFLFLLLQLKFKRFPTHFLFHLVFYLCSNCLFIYSILFVLGIFKIEDLENWYFAAPLLLFAPLMYWRLAKPEVVE